VSRLSISRRWYTDDSRERSAEVKAITKACLGCDHLQAVIAEHKTLGSKLQATLKRVARGSLSYALLENPDEMIFTHAASFCQFVIGCRLGKGVIDPSQRRQYRRELCEVTQQQVSFARLLTASMFHQVKKKCNAEIDQRL